MWGIIRYLRGISRLQILGASPQTAINRLAKQKIGFWDLEVSDPFTYNLCVLQKDCERAIDTIKKAQCDCSVVKMQGLLHDCGGLLKRPGIWAALAAAVMIPTILSRFIWTIDVSGNTSIPTEQVLQQLSEVGVYVGAYGPSIKSQDIKNRMLNRIPELQWIAVNRTGGRVQVLLEERDLRPKVIDRKAVHSLVAARTGLVTKVEVYEGEPLCKVGQTVLQGQLLVSGYQEFEVNVKKSNAMAEIYARTWRKCRLVFPSQVIEKEYTGHEIRRYALQIGRKRINLSPNSGIYQGDYDKILSYQYLTLPGGVQFPVCLITETYKEYDTLEVDQELEEAEATASEACQKNLLKDMIAGEIRSSTVKSRIEGNNIEVDLVFECEEMIARSVESELFEGEQRVHDGKND